MFKNCASVVIVLMLAAGTASSQTEREPASLGKKYVGCVAGSAAKGYMFAEAAPGGSNSTRSKRYGLVAGKGLTTDLSTMVGKRVEIVATLAEERHSAAASSSNGGASSTREATSAREILTANQAQIVPGACTP